jgi:hypothetical protein
MPNKKKTRKQKIVADMRHQLHIQTADSPKPEPLSPHVESNIPQVIHNAHQSSLQSIATSHYQYLYSDLFKTAVLTISIIVAELLLRYAFFGAS